MLHYYKSLKDANGYTYSIDRLRLVGWFRADLLDFVQSIVSVDNPDIYISEPCFRDWKYRYFIQYGGNETTVTMFQGFNSYDVDDRKKFVFDFNPNKINDVQRKWVRDLIAKSIKCEIKRCDVAIDIPIPREHLSLQKDNRIYQYYEKSRKDLTEYLGTRSEVGFCKLYNKQIESKLDYPLTRLEITCEPYLASFNAPECVYNVPRETLGDQLNDTDYVLVQLLNKLPPNERNIYIRQLGRRKRKTIEDALFKTSVGVITVDGDIVQLLFKENRQDYEI